LLTIGFSTVTAAASARTIGRCGFTSSPYGRVGVYVVKGRVPCAEAEFLIGRAFYNSGVATNLPDASLFQDGWLCGGQMGFYNCATPTFASARLEVQAIACHLGSVRCPASTRTSINTGAEPKPLGIAKCIPASYLEQGSAAGSRTAAQQLTPSLEVRLAGHAETPDLNFALLASKCGSATAKRAWYVDLHPPGMACGACDSHEYWVQLRSGEWATLEYFGG